MPMVVVERSYSRARLIIKKVFTVLAVVLGFFVLLGLPSAKMPKFLGMGGAASSGVVHADYVPSSSSDSGGDGSGCDSADSGSCS